MNLQRWLGVVCVLAVCCRPSEQSIIKASVPEDEPSGYVVYRFPTPTGDEIFKVLDSRYTESLELLKLFEISESGVLTTKQPLIYDETGKNTYEITVVKRKRGESSGGQAFTLLVAITDINNHVPTFGFKIYNGTIMENSPENTKVEGIVNCHAEDKDTSGIKGYKIIGGNDKGYFKLSTMTVSDEIFLEVKTTNVPIILTKDGSNKKITLVVEVEDNGTPSQKASTTIVVTVIPANTHSPIFEQNEYKANISEELQIMSTALEVHADDKDSGRDGGVYYILKPLSKYFTVNPINGQIEVIHGLDYSVQNVFDLTVFAMDRGMNPKQSSAKVELTIQEDLSHIPPKAAQNPGKNTAPLFQSALAISLREDLPVGAFVTLVIATDHDPPGPNGQLTYSLSGDNKNNFQMASESGLVTLKSKLDFESIEVHNLTVTATDKGSPPLSTSTFLIIYVIDVNENYNPPIFQPAVRSLDLPENTPIGTSVMTASATDSDAGVDGKLIYSAMSGEGISYLRVDENTGEVFTKAFLDEEVNKHFELLIVAHDSGNFPIRSRLYIVVHVKSVDDQYPQFLKAEYNATVPDGSPVDTFVTVLHAVDMDRSGGLVYSIKNPDTKDPFKIEVDTGVIRTKQTLNTVVSGKEKYQLTIEVKNGQRISQALVNIKIVKSPDTAPKFLSSSYDVQVREDMGKIDSLICLAATDSATDSLITYSIKTGDTKTFAVGSTSGK